jgi:hypothetical protein
MKTYIALSLALLTSPLVAAAEPCVKESLIEFRSAGVPIASERVGDNPKEVACGFGGNKVFTPKFKLQVYANLNIPGVVDLDAIDASFEKHAVGRSHGELLTNPGFHFVIAFVKDAWYKKMAYDAVSPDAVLNGMRNILFVPEESIKKGDLAKIWDNIFSQESIWGGFSLSEPKPSKPSKQPLKPKGVGVNYFPAHKNVEIVPPQFL